MARRKPSETPLMRQYLATKAEHPDAILLFRVGDFHEMFFEDAVLAAKLLGLTLTTRDKGKADSVPMCGVPHHATRSYVAKLTDLGHKVALCEQTEDPKKAKGLVKREVVQVVTPGVVLDDEVLDPKIARYVAAISVAKSTDLFGLAYLDVSTGEYRAAEITSVESMLSELARIAPKEIIATDADVAGLEKIFSRLTHVAQSIVPAMSHQEAKKTLKSAVGEVSVPELCMYAAANVLAYARATQPSGLLPVTRLQVYAAGDSVVLDQTAVANLELVATRMGCDKNGSLLSVLDQTATGPGGRLLRRWLLYPLKEVAMIRRRQDAVEFLVSHATIRTQLGAVLKHIGDLERLAGRISLAVATPRDLGRVQSSLGRLPEIFELLRAGQAESKTGRESILTSLPELLVVDETLVSQMAEIEALLAQALVDEPPAHAREGGVIREGYCSIVDDNRRLADGGKSTILAIEAREREATGIASLKVKYNRVFGYYIEVTKSQLDRVPASYVRKQTVATGERYVTPELAELEAKILAAQEALHQREQELFVELCATLAKYTSALGKMGAYIATLDCTASLAQVAHTSNYVRPLVDDSLLIDIAGGRHPVVERMVGTNGFVPNDCRLDPDDEQILLVTGPNMAGKSTFMRQVAQIVVLAQMGSFVPAESATIGVVDRVFTRVGAADNLAEGQSTFMVEMCEAAAILSDATRRSLVVLDEVGRGTSTFDGVSIAWAVTEYLHDAIGARTVFATHYHELCGLAESRPRVRNVSVAIREHNGAIVFLHQVVPGGAPKSYGIDVARLAGLPRSVIARARQMLAQLEKGHHLVDSNQMSLFANMAPTPPAGESPSALESMLSDVDPNAMTPIEALNLVARLCQKLPDRQ